MIHAIHHSEPKLPHGTNFPSVYEHVLRTIGASSPHAFETRPQAGLTAQASQKMTWAWRCAFGQISCLISSNITYIVYICMCIYRNMYMHISAIYIYMTMAHRYGSRRGDLDVWNEGVTQIISNELYIFLQFKRV